MFSIIGFVALAIKRVHPRLYHDFTNQKRSVCSRSTMSVNDLPVVVVKVGFEPLSEMTVITIAYAFSIDLLQDQHDR